MRIADVKRWEWAAIALVIGLACGLVRQTSSTSDRLDEYERLFTDPQQFETAATTEAYGHRLFEGITVYPFNASDRKGGKERVHLVTGRYWNGQPVVENGQTVAHYVPACFVARVPFKAQTLLTQSRPGGGAFPTVLEYLDFLHERAKVNYRYAWWAWMQSPVLVWTLGALILMGGIWPTLVNLLAFGTFGRPPEAKGISLRDVKGAQTAAEPPPAQVPDDHLRELEQELEVSLSDAAPPTDPSSAVPVCPLKTSPLEPAAALPPSDPKEFGTDKEDFYPTELHGHEDKPA